MHAIAVGAMIKRNSDLVASHESAAYLHGIDLLLPAGATVPPVTLTRRPQEPSRSLVRGALIRVAMLPDDHVTTVLGVPATTAARTVMDIARTTGFMEGVVAADSALYKHAVVKVEFAIVLRDCAQWKGIVRARQVLNFADGRAESALESVRSTSPGARSTMNRPPPSIACAAPSPATARAGMPRHGPSHRGFTR